MNMVPVQFGLSFINHPHDAGELSLRPGDRVVVDSEKGPALGRINGLVERQVVERGKTPRIIRIATERDIERDKDNESRAREAFVFCLKRIRSRNLKMKLCQVEYMLDGSRALFYFSAERRVDFRQLVRDLAKELNIRIEMRQIGVRDGAGVVGGIGPCGKELCCSSFLTNFSSVSIRHAKDQGLTLNPKKVSGMCGRLMCCLVYEHATYKAGKRGAPRLNRAVSTELGEGVVTEVDLLRRYVRVLLANGSSEEFPFAEVIVDNDTVLKPRDFVSAAPSRPRTDAKVTRAGARLAEQYVWDGAEADVEVDDSSPKPAKERSSGEDSGDEKRGPRRRRRRRRGPSSGGGGSAKPNQPELSRPREAAQSEKSPSSGEGDEKPKRRRRRRRRSSKPAGDGAPPKKSES
ncbi:MAG: hypothetical protein KC561_05010 [Myxococcales bacterium]|nr:hypothetical protein [Myxococcales bacterium]